MGILEFYLAKTWGLPHLGGTAGDLLAIFIYNVMNKLSFRIHIYIYTLHISFFSFVTFFLIYILMLFIFRFFLFTVYYIYVVVFVIYCAVCTLHYLILLLYSSSVVLHFADII